MGTTTTDGSTSRATAPAAGRTPGWTGFVASALASAWMLGSSAAPARSASAQPFPAPAALRSAEARDAAGNVVRDARGERVRYGYDEVGNAHAADHGEPPSRPAGGGAAPAPAAGALDPDDALDLERIWSFGIWGTSIGRTGMEVVDLDGDGQREIVLGSSAGGFAWNSAFRVARWTADGYEIVWTSDPPLSESVTIGRVRALEIDGRMRVLVGRTDGVLEVYDGATLVRETRFPVDGAGITDLLLADADNDGAEELVVASPERLHLLDPSDWLPEHELAQGAREVAVGNVDADPALEIVLSSGAVIEYDGLSATTEWDFSGFGAGPYLGLADLDGDGMQEIVSAHAWDYVDVYDADLRSPKFQLPTDLDIQALLLADVTGDGRAEILYGDGQWGSIHAHDGGTGAELWSIPNPEHGTTRIAVADADDDGALEVMWGAGWTSTGPDYFYVHDVATRAREFQSADVVGPFAALARGDVDGDGEDELVAASAASDSSYGNGIVHVFDAESFALEWRSGRYLLSGSWYGISDVAIGDVDGDGAVEIVVVAGSQMAVIDGASRVVEREYRYAFDTTLDAIALDQLDGDPALEIVAAGNKLSVIDGASGRFQWQSIVLAPDWPGASAVESVDLDGDGAAEIVATLDEVVVVDGAARTVAQSRATGNHGLAIGDLDGDGTLEIWTGTAGGQLARFDPTTLEGAVVAPVCGERVNSVRMGLANALVGTIQFACDDGIGTWAPETGVSWWSGSIGVSIGLTNNLVVRDAGAHVAQLVAGTRTGLVAYQGFGTSNLDVDVDGVPNLVDVCPLAPDPEQADRDGDRIGDACNDVHDGDGDEWADALDVCPAVADPAQGDADGDRIGDACNDIYDGDGDEWADAFDNCPAQANAAQENGDGDPLGDLCDPYPDASDNAAARCAEAIENELVLTAELIESRAEPRWLDADGDGEDDRSDACPDTPAGEAVDTAGCSKPQYCATLSSRRHAICRAADWRNDEPHKPAPRDCQIEWVREGGEKRSACGAR